MGIWEDNIKMNLKERRCDSVEWIYFSHDRDECTVLFHKNGNFLNQLRYC